MNSAVPDLSGRKEESGKDGVMARVEDQINWYDRKSHSCLQWFKTLKTLTIIVASAIPVVTGTVNSIASSRIAGGLGALIAVLEGVQQLNQYHANWISYRSTCEALKHEKYLFAAAAGPYAKSSTARALFAERVEQIMSQENTKWSSRREPEHLEDTKT